ncbi:MAG: fibronectin type III domain-containing protein [Bacteroidales bacterium]|jgi:hypothetical protein|nr:fibronectin type III domain-containing protein [Bacteroidales bacterium]MCI1785710.1 fibronectin type III domain-containing protein [Bacteroidales bacterium]
MKKVFIYIAIFASVIGLFAACDASDNDVTSEPVVASDPITVTFSNVTETSFDVTLAPQGKAAYYSYLVDQSDVAETLDSLTLYEVGYKSLAKGTFKYADKNTVTFTVSDLTPNTTYQVYAVSSSETGVPSSVAVAAVTTIDNTDPWVSDSKVNADSTLKITFSEAVKAGSGKLKARIYALNVWSGAKYDGYDSVYVDVSKAVISGDAATVRFDIPSGAYYTVDVPAGAFTDTKGNPCEAMESYFYYSSGMHVHGIYGIMDTKDFTMGDFAYDTLSTSSAKNYIEINVPAEGVDLGGMDKSKTIMEKIENGSVSTTYSDLVYSTYWGLTINEDAYYAMIKMAAVPVNGDKVTVTVPKDTFEDYFGNPNAEWTGSFVYENAAGASVPAAGNSSVQLKPNAFNSPGILKTREIPVADSMR